MRAVPESDDYLMAGAVFTALNLLNMLLWAAGLYLPVWAWAAVLLLCLWPALRHQRLNGLIAVGLMVVFVLAQGLYLARYMKDEPKDELNEEPKP